MRDEPARDGRLGRRALFAAALAALVMATPARSQTVRGFAEVQYQSQDQRGGLGTDVERYGTAVHLDYGRRIRNAYDLTVQGEWNEVTYIDRPNKQTNPRGAIRLAHIDWGSYASYRTYRVTDALGITTRQRETTLNAYLRKPGIPQIQGTYLRRRTLDVGLTPASTGTTTNLNARHELGPLGLRAAWTNQIRFADENEEATKTTQNSYGGGADWRWARNKTSATATADVQETKLTSLRGPASTTGTASLSLNGTHRFTKVVDAGLTYAYQHTSTRSTTTRNLDDHDGSLLFSARPKPSLIFSAGGGLRTTQIGERYDIERYVVAQAGAIGPIRRHWTGNVNLSRSYNWFQGQDGRPVNSGVVNTNMRLIRGLDVNAQFQVTKAAANATIADTAGTPTTLTSQVVYGFTATPLLRLAFGFSRTSYRTGGNLIDPEASSRTDTWDARWNPVISLRLSGNLSNSRGLGPNEPTLTTAQTTVDWSPVSTFQWSGSYSRSDRAQYNPLTQTVAGSQVWSSRLVALMAQIWRLQLSVNDVDPGEPTHVRQWDATLTRILGR
ncbi:MAG TPA: hypothetical protein VFS09_06145 [Candidatus Eisenbacteria bacterium]|nr:hypothetical protein [Candidatus Eisenbacteria bacterium]